MPWEVKQRDDKWLVVKQGSGEVVGTHDSEDGAKRQLAALNINVKEPTRYAFDPFADFKPGEPIRILPEGTWYRGQRTLLLTRDRLKEIAANFAKGLPKFRVGINLDHKDDQGKVGDIKQVAYMESGPKGAGVYATEYDLTDRGARAIEHDGYDGVSAEVVWTLNGGAKYQDPETGQLHDNVLVGLALTPRPFFGHDHVALYHDQPEAHDMTNVVGTPEMEMPCGGATSWDEYDQWTASEGIRSSLSELNAQFRMMTDNVMGREDIEDKSAAVAKLAEGYQEKMRAMKQGPMAKLMDDMKAWFAETFQHAGHEGPSGPHAGHEGGGGEGGGGSGGGEGGGGGGGGGGGSSPASRDKARADFRFLNQRLAAGNFKPGEKALLERRAEAAAKIVLGVEESASEVEGEQFMEMTPELKAMMDKKMSGMDPEEKKRHEEMMKNMSPAQALAHLESLSDSQEVESMGETINVEKLQAEVAAKDAELKQATERLTALESERSAERLSARKEALKTEAMSYKNLGFKVDEYVEHFVALEDKAPEQAEWFRAQYAGFEKLAENLPREIGSGLEGTTDDFDALVTSVVKSEFKGDMGKYPEALAIAAQRNPELARRYAARKEA